MPNSNFQLTLDGATVLSELAADPTNASVIRESKYWQRGLDELVRHGLAEAEFGFCCLTEDGKSFASE